MTKLEHNKLTEIVEGYFQGRTTEQEEMVYVVEQYILIGKGKKVVIDILKDMHGKTMSELKMLTLLKRQLDLLIVGCERAVKWLLENREEWSYETI